MTRGKEHLDVRNVINAMVHLHKSGAQWVDASRDYGPKTPLYDRLIRWAEKGITAAPFEELASAEGPPIAILIDSMAVKAQLSAAGGKGNGRTIDPSCGGRPIKIHAPTHTQSRPLAFKLEGELIAGGGAIALLERLRTCGILMRTKAACQCIIRRQLEDHGVLSYI